MWIDDPTFFVLITSVISESFTDVSSGGQVNRINIRLRQLRLTAYSLLKTWRVLARHRLKQQKVKAQKQQQKCESEGMRKRESRDEKSN
jgi:hypothetical protein